MDKRFSLNRDKRSVILDLKTEAGHNALVRLARSGDILIENSRPGAMAALGLDDPGDGGAQPAAHSCFHLRN